MDAVGSRSRSGIGGGWVRRRSVLGALVLAVVAVAVAAAALVAALGPRGSEAAGRGGERSAALAALAAVPGGGAGGAAVQVQMVPDDRPSVVVNGFGEAGAPAEAAVVQLIVRGSGGGGPEEKPTDSSEPFPPPGQPPALADEDLAPIVEAIVATGVAESDVEATPSSPFGGPFGPGSAQVVVTVGAEGLETIADIVAAGTEAAQASPAGLFVEFVGVGYTVADCTGLERDARQDAADDARTRAEGLAEVVGLTLGDVLLVSDGGYYGGPDSGLASGCAEEPLAEISSGKGYSLPPFDPNAEAEVEVYANLSLAYAVE